MFLSIVVPLYNEEESVAAMHAAIDSAMSGFEGRYEILFIDDGSRDRTFALASELAERDPNLRVVKFRRNYGQTPAMAAGIDTARGDIIVTMDGDLQNDPRDIGQLIEELDRGYDIVVGWRHDRQDKLLSRKVPSVIANWLIGRVTGVPIKDNGCSLKAFRARVIKNIPLYSEMHRFIPAMASIATPRIQQVKVRHHARRFGQSKYGLKRTYRVMADILTINLLMNHRMRPFVWFVAMSSPFFFFGFVCVALTINFPNPLIWIGSSMILLATGISLVAYGLYAELLVNT